MGLVVGWQKADWKADLKLKGGWLCFVCSMCLMFHSNVSFQENKIPIWQKKKNIGCIKKSKLGTGKFYLKRSRWGLCARGI